MARLFYFTSRFAALALLVSVMACSVPDLDRYDPVQGELTGMDVSAPVSVVRDKNGCVHIAAENDEDLFYAVGFSMAQDRFMMMEMFRRAGAGRLSELIGSPVKLLGVDLPHIDIMARTLQFERSAKEGVAAMDPESRALLEAFTRGVNKYLESGGRGIQFNATFGQEPAPWTMEDGYVVAGLMGLTMSYSAYLDEYYLERIRRDHGDEVRDFFMPHYPDDWVIITRDEPLLAAAPRPFLPGPLEGLGSNNWALAGNRTRSGKPLLCNDPHVPITIAPTFWYHCHIKSPNYDVMGLMFSGFPCYGAATNGKLGWVLTNVGMDYVDLWREKVNPDDPSEYMAKGEWVPFEIEKGEVKISGKKPLAYDMRHTRHGVVIEKDLLGWNVPSEPGEVMAIRFVDMDYAAFFKGYQEMARAKNLEEWKDGAAGMSMGPFAWNHTYADADGNIAYWTSGHIPIRSDNQGAIARKGWEEESDWRGFVPFQDNPHLVNPKKGYIATANNRVETPDYPYYITQGYIGPSRAHRISELIEEKPIHDAEDMKRIQYDVSVYSARTMVPLILGDLEGTSDPVLKKAAAILREWEGRGYRADLDSRGVCVYEFFTTKFPEAVFGDELKGTLTVAMRASSLMQEGLNKIIDDPDNAWYDDVRTMKRETRKDITRKTMRRAMKRMYRNQGLLASRWRWGDVSVLTLSPAFVSIPGATKKYSKGPYPVPGTGETINAANHFGLGPLGYMDFVGPSSRIIVDFDDPRKIIFNATSGNGDNPRSARYNNLMPAWLEGQYFIMSMDEQDYRDQMMGELIIAP